MAQSIREIIDTAEAVEPIAEKNGERIVTFNDATAIANMEHLEKEHGKSEKQRGNRTYNGDGSLARLRYDTVAINPHNYFLNRFYKAKNSKKMKVVIDFRAITEQQSGKCYISQIPCFVVSRDENGKLFIEGIDLVRDTDFISDYTNTLNEEAMKEIAPLIANFGTNVTESELPI